MAEAAALRRTYARSDRQTPIWGLSRCEQQEFLNGRARKKIHVLRIKEARRPDLASVLGAPKGSGRPRDCAHLVERRQEHSLDIVRRSAIEKPMP